MTRLFLVDDHLVFRHGLSILLAQQGNLQVVGQASTGQDLLDQLPTVPTDLVILTLNTPALESLETARRLRRDYPRLRVLLLSMVTAPALIQKALTTGVHGYAHKRTSAQELLLAVALVSEGQRFLSSELGLSLLNLPATFPLSNPLLPFFSSRELEILDLMAEGLTIQQIAGRLFCSFRTIESHRQHMIRRTQTKNATSLVVYALAKGYIDPPANP